MPVRVYIVYSIYIHTFICLVLTKPVVEALLVSQLMREYTPASYSTYLRADGAETERVYILIYAYIINDYLRRTTYATNNGFRCVQRHGIYMCKSMLHYFVFIYMSVIIIGRTLMRCVIYILLIKVICLYIYV